MKTTRKKKKPFARIQLLSALLPRAAFTLAFTTLLSCQSAQADALTWDTDPAVGITAGTGAWNTTALNTVWNNAGTNVPWTQGGTTTASNSAIFAGADAAAAETYIVTLGAQIATSGLTFNNTGYKLEGTSGLSFPVSTIIETAAGKSVTIACPLIGGNVVNNWLARLDSNVNITGNTSGSQQPNFIGESGAGTTGKFNFSGTTTFSVLTVNAPVNITDGTFAASTTFIIGRLRTAVNGVTPSTGTVTLDGVNAILNHNGGGSGNNTMIGRDAGIGTLVIKNGTFNTATSNNAHDVAIPQDNNAASQGTFDVQGGTVNIGSTTNNTAKINFGRIGLTNTQTATMTQSGGTITSHGGILFGGSTAGTYTGTATWTMTGGSLYLGAGGISEGTLSASEAITLSGGTVGAIVNWTGSLPMTLGTTNGDVTFQCADSIASPFDIALTQTLTGLGGLKKTGSGKLTLSGVNDYSGTTLVSNGTLTRVTGATPSVNGPLTLDGSVDSPTVSVTVSNSNQYWGIGNLTCAAGTTTADVQYGVLSPSSAVPPIQVTGDIAFTSTPLMTVGGAAIGVGTYPLIQYTGAFSGTAPTTVSLPAYCSGIINHNTITKTIELVVQSSTFVPPVSWAVGDGVWNTTTPNWQKSGGPVTYSNGDPVILDDTASGTSPITISLDTIVSPNGVTANATKNYVITGTGAISGSGAINLLEAGSLTLSGLNTYSGGTNLSAGQLNINNGGTVSSSAIGTGTLTINSGAALDNTSGSNVALLSVNAQQWNGNFSYQGSANSLHTGTGPVTLGGNVSTNVVASTLTVGGEISGDFKLTKTGGGTLALTAANTFTGGMTLSAGGLNVADPSSIGFGQLTLGGGTIDNTSGGDLVLTPSSTLLGSAFSFVGSDNLTIDGNATLQTPNTPSAINVVAKTLTFSGAVTLANTVVTKSGPGTLTYSGNSSNTGGIIINEGSVNLGKANGTVVTNVSGVTVNTTGSLVITDDGGDQIADGNSGLITPVILSGGLFDLNGRSEKIDSLSMSGGAILRNAAAASVSTLTLRTGLSVTLSNSGGFDVTEADGVLNILGPIVGTGELHKTGAGTLTLSGANLYSGTTSVEVGTLAVTGSLGASVVTVSDAATLSGNGNIGGDVTIQSGGRHALAVAASKAAQITRVISGTLTLAAGNILDLTEPVTPSGGTYVLATATTIAGTPTTLNYGGAGTFSIDTVSSPNRLLLTIVGSANYASWAIDQGIPGEPALGDFENDGITNLVEYALGTNPKVSTQPAGVLAGNVITFTKGADAIANGDVSWAIETSETLAAGTWTPQVTQAAGDLSATIAHTFTPGSPAKNFARLKVIQAP